jgi:hypothetical protein
MFSPSGSRRVEKLTGGLKQACNIHLTSFLYIPGGDHEKKNHNATMELENTPPFEEATLQGHRLLCVLETNPEEQKPKKETHVRVHLNCTLPRIAITFRFARCLDLGSTCFNKTWAQEKQ